MNKLIKAAMDAETLLTNYLAQDKFPKGSDCEEVRDNLRSALKSFGDFDMQIASLCDLLNSWAREIGVAECENPFNGAELKKLADRIWSKTSDDLWQEKIRVDG